MSDEELRLHCLQLAAQRLGPAASRKDLFAEAKWLHAFCQGFDQIDIIDGKEMAGKRA